MSVEIVLDPVEAAAVVVQPPAVSPVQVATLPTGGGGGGPGGMDPLIYDPRAIEADVFDLSHSTGPLDGGVFT